MASDGHQLVTVGFIGDYPSLCTGFAYSSGPLVGVRMTNAPSRQVALSGLMGLSYRVDDANSLSGAGITWQTLATLQLTNALFYLTDLSNTGARFYRGALLP